MASKGYSDAGLHLLKTAIEQDTRYNANSAEWLQEKLASFKKDVGLLLHVVTVLILVFLAGDGRDIDRYPDRR